MDYSIALCGLDVLSLACQALLHKKWERCLEWLSFVPRSDIWPTNGITGKRSHDTLVVVYRNRKSDNRVLLTRGLVKAWELVSVQLHNCHAKIDRPRACLCMFGYPLMLFMWTYTTDMACSHDQHNWYGFFQVTNMTVMGFYLLCTCCFSYIPMLLLEVNVQYTCGYTVKTQVGRAHHFVSHSTPKGQLVCWQRQIGGLCPPLFLQCKYNICVWWLL